MSDGVEAVLAAHGGGLTPNADLSAWECGCGTAVIWLVDGKWFPSDSLDIYHRTHLADAIRAALSAETAGR